MKFKKLSGFLATLMLLASFGTTTFASTTINQKSEINRPKITNEQKAEMKAKHDQMNKKWSALTDAQKEEIYKLMDKEINIKIQTIDEYQSLGLIDKETATEMKTRLTEKKTKIREKDEFPMFGKKGGHR